MLRIMLVVALACVLAMASCAGEKLTTGLDRSTDLVQVSLDAGTSIGADGVELSLVAAADGTLAVQADNLSGAKALYGAVHYDPQQMHVEGSLPAELTTDNALLLAVDQPALGQVVFGWVLAGLDERAGISGSRELLQISFAPGAARVASKVTAKAPTGNYNRFTLDGSITDNVPTLTWLETNAGDGDNNGECNISDMTPLGISINKPIVSSQNRDADFDKNGEVNINDITALGVNLTTTLAGYAIFSGATEANLTEQERFARTTMFTTPPKTADGELTWVWVGTAITATTVYKVQPYDSQGVLGQASDNAVTLIYENPTPIVTGINSITFEGADTWFNKVGTDFTVLLTELSVDPTDGNAEPLTGVEESLQLKAMVTTDQDPGEVDGSELVTWYISEGAGLARVSNAAGTKGLLTFHWQDLDGNDVHGDRGRIVVEAQVPGNFNNKKTVSFALMTIDSLELQTSSGSSGPVALNSGQTLGLKALGTFDFDNVANGNEYTAEITPYVNWAALVDPVGSEYSIDTNAGVLDTTGAASGAEIRVTCEFPGTDNVTLYDDEKRFSNFLTVNIN